MATRRLKCWNGSGSAWATTIVPSGSPPASPSSGSTSTSGPIEGLPKRIRRPQICHQIPHGEGFFHILRGQGLAIMLQHLRACIHHFGGQWDVAGHDHIPDTRAICDPHIGHVRAFGDNHILNQWVLRRPQPAIRHDKNLHPMACRDTFDLGFHRAGVRIHIDGRHDLAFLLVFFATLNSSGIGMRLKASNPAIR